MANFASSDIDFSSEDEAPRIGKRAMASIVQQSVTDRVESKKTMKKLKDIGNAPSTTIDRRYWLKLFNQFAAVTLHIEDRPSKTPTGDDVARFIAELPSHLESRHRSGQVAWTVIKKAQMQLDHALSFHHEHYKLTKRDGLRIDAVFQKLLDDGRVTKDAVREKQWITCQMVKRLATAVFSDAIENGTKSWDCTLAGSFGLVLQAALISRSGDFRRSNHYKGDEHIKWKDLDLVATVVGGEVVLKMLVKLSYRKNCKRDSTKAMSFEFGQLSESDSVVDPTKLCVAYALRVGAVNETSWSDLIAVVLSRPSKRFVWTKPDSPVFYALTRGQRLDFSAPAPIDQQRRFLRQAAGLVGMLQMPVSHDLRRGGAADIYSIKSSVSSGDVNKVRKLLGHSNASAAKGTTDAYIGREKGDSWAERLEQSTSSDRDSFGIQVAPEAFKQRKVMTADIDNYCKTHHLDKTVRRDRDVARRALATQQYDQWSARHRAMMNTASTDNAVEPSQTLHNESLVGTDGVLQQQHIVEESPTEKSAGTPTDLSNESLVEAAVLMQQQHAVDKSSSAESTSMETRLELANIDPALRLLGDEIGIQDMTNEVHNTEGNDLESLARGCVSMLATPEGSGGGILTAETASFVGYLSTINLVSIAIDTLPDGLEEGNSRDIPSRFLFHCGMEHCSRTFNTSLRRDLHRRTCSDKGGSFEHDASNLAQSGTSIEIVARPPRKRKRTDINKAGDNFPKPCPDSGICGVTKDFATPHLLKNHRALHHDEKWPAQTPCGFPDCQLPRDHYFISREAYRRHLASYHLLDTGKAREYIGKVIPLIFTAPRGVSKSYMTTLCLFPDCKCDAEFATYTDYTSHLKRTHGLAAERYPEFMPTANTVRLHPRPGVIDVDTPLNREFVSEKPCSHEDCAMSKATFNTKAALNKHLNKSHDIGSSDAPKFYPGREIVPFYGTECLHANCSNKGRFWSTEAKYKGHLRTAHKLSAVDEVNSMQL